MDERKRELLNRLEAFFKDDEDTEEVSLFTKEELNAPMDVLRLLITDYGPGLMDVLVEFSFLPLNETEVLFFSTVITIKMNVPKDGVSALSGAIARLNFYLPYGAFALSSDGSMLIYKSVVPLRSDKSDDELYETMELSADNSILVPESYTDLLVQVSEGRMLLNEFIGSLPAMETDEEADS